MKKLLFTLMLMLTCQLTFGQTAKSIFDDYKNEKHAQFVSVPRIMMSIAANKVGDNNMQAVMKEVKSVKVLTLDDCRKSTRKGFVKKITALSGRGYEEFTRVKDNKDNVLVLAKQGDRYIEEIVVLVSDDNDCVGIYITGEINPEDIDAVVSMAEDY
ncbi:MAG: DUF4252 domain-containing protein [Prevotella sp.]|nr:DUF4252 domain-containing protein [Prevotella sp.]